MRKYFLILFVSILASLGSASLSAFAAGDNATDGQGFLGVVLEPVGPGVIGVAGLASGASAQKVGVKEGDIILKFQGKPVHSSAELIEAVKKTAPGKTAELVVKRGGKVLPFQILIVSRKEFLGEEIEALKGKSAPELVGTNAATGQKIAVSQFAGKPLVIALWATWCPACRHGIPRLDELAKTNKGKLEIMAVTFENLDVVKKFSAETPVSYDMVAADQKNLSMSYMNNASIPKYLLVNAKGIVTGIYQRVEDLAQAYAAL